MFGVRSGNTKKTTKKRESLLGNLVHW